MSRPRLELDAILRDLLGSNNVYFQPPEKLRMSYPCIRYSWDRTFDQFSNDRRYIKHKGYMLTCIGKNPDDPLFERLLALPLCSFVRQYIADNLIHTVFLIYF